MRAALVLACVAAGLAGCGGDIPPHLQPSYDEPVYGARGGGDLPDALHGAPAPAHDTRLARHQPVSPRPLRPEVQQAGTQ